MKNESRHARAKILVKSISLAMAVIIAGIAAWWWAKNLPSHLPAYRTGRPTLEHAPAPAEPQKPSIDWAKVDQQIVTALLQAESAAETTATQKLDAWVAVLMRRVDEDFLEWYFGYWTQQKLEVTGAWRWTLDQVI